MDHTSELDLPDESATLALAAQLAHVLQSGAVIFLQGDLGAGKTTFTRGLLRTLGHQGKVKSPTYSLVESYVFDPFTVHHFDLYRFADPEEWEDAGFRELFGPDAICLVEWPEKAHGLLPAPDLVLTLSVHGSGRHARFTALTETGNSCLKRLSTQAAADC